KMMDTHVNGLAIPGVELVFRKGFIFPLRLTIPGYNYIISPPGEVAIKETGKILRFREVRSYRKPGGNNEIIFPFSLCQFPLTLRNPFREDKYIKINTSIKQKVIEMIRAAGFPSQLRNLCPVLCNGDGEIIWVMGSPLAEKFKVTDEREKKFLKVA
ncbi:MAG: hypothetical protein GY950_06065, partial [bacterium]|nr:hypothetical protein [bacterium]